MINIKHQVYQDLLRFVLITKCSLFTKLTLLVFFSVYLNIFLNGLNHLSRCHLM